MELKELKLRHRIFFKQLQMLIEYLQNSMQSKWNRSLPIGDLLNDRWKRAKNLKFGEGSTIYDSALVFGTVIVGKNTWIGPFTILDGSGNLEIGDGCNISAGVQIYTHDTVTRCLNQGNAPLDYALTKIGSYCYIGPNTIISKGVIIGNQCVIGANSLVLHDIPPNSKAFGTPCKVVGHSINQPVEHNLEKLEQHEL